MDVFMRGNTSSFWLAETRRIVGFARSGFDRHTVSINDPSVLAFSQKLVVGRAFTQKVEQELTSVDNPKIIFLINNENHVLSAFCGRLGYVVDHMVALSRHKIRDQKSDK